MRILAAAAMLLAAAASLFAGDDDDEGGVELLYEFRDGEAPAAAKAIEKRLEQLEGTIVRPLEDGKRVLVQIQKQYQRELTRAAAERLGHLELRRAVDTDTKEFLTRRVAFHAALDRGEEIDKIREIPAESLTAEERKRSPGGLRWYKNPSPKDPPNDDWILCEIDAHGITEQALEDVSLAPAEYSDDRFDVRFHVKAEFQDKMAELTSVEDMRLPIILDGEIVAAPVVHSQIRDRGSITIGLTEACVILVAFKDGVLPSKPKLVAERRITNPEEKEGAELLYEFRDGEAPAAAKVLQRRLDLLGVTASVTPVEDGKRVGVRVRGRDRLEDVRDAAARVGHLELRRAADRSANEYMARWMALQTAIRRGEDVEKIREIPADSLSAEERKRSPGGLRWYKDPGSTRPSQDWVLCEIDADGITEEAIGEIRVVPSVFRFYEIRVSVKKGFQEKMADLTSRPYTVLAVIVDGEFVGAPLVRGQLREEGTIRITGEREARRIAAALGGGVLPSEPKLLAERWVGR